MAGSAPPPAEPNPEVLSWLKSLPLAPEYHPTLAEFQDPIAYIFKIEKEASKYGICKIVPPVPPSPRKTSIANFNRSLAARAACSDSSSSKSQPTFTTRQQQIGFCPRKPRPVQRPVWQSGEHYTFQKFEAKAKAFEKSYLKKCTKKGGLPPLEIETLYWKATLDKPFSVEYANDMPGSAFVPNGSRKYREGGEGVTLGETAWNMRGVSRANGSLLRFMKEEIPGVTSPMVYVAMMFSWFAWHVEDHDLHSLNYLHMGAGKTWYGVPREAAVAFEEVVRVHGYGGEINPLVTFAILGEKTTVMSPEVFIAAGVPCCRLVQNAGEFVVTFPRAYHTGFSHGFNCGEAANIATPGWLKVAKEAAVRRASINYPPMVSHSQLLYDLALDLCSRIPSSINAEPRSSRLKDKKRGEGETVIKETFVQDVVHNNDLLHVLGKGSSIVLLPYRSTDSSVGSKLWAGSQLKVNPEDTLSICKSKEGMNSSKGLVSDDLMFEQNLGSNQVKGIYSVKGKFATLCQRNNIPSLNATDDACGSVPEALSSDTKRDTTHCDRLSDQGLFSCVTCGIICFTCVAIVQPKEPAVRYLMSSDCSFFNDWVVRSGVSADKLTVANEDIIGLKQNTVRGLMENNVPDGLYDVPVQSASYQIQIADQKNEVASNLGECKTTTALGLLASTYGDISDSEDLVEPEIDYDYDKSNCSSGPKSHHEISGLPSYNENCHGNAIEGCNAPLLRHNDEDVPECGHQEENYKDKSHETFDCSLGSENDKILIKSSDSVVPTQNSQVMPYATSYSSQDACDSDKPMFSKAMVAIDTKNTSYAMRTDEDSSRMHVFCLEHALNVEQQLLPIGGVQMLLLCHPDYPKIEAQAKSVAEELGSDYPWNDVSYRNATSEDEETIQSALDSEDAIPGNGDWAVKLGVNLFYSSILSRSPLYSKQMPYNTVIYDAFGRSSPGCSSIKPKVYRRRAGMPKKVVAGKWCGKVWMSSQVHPFLAKRDSEDEDDGGGGERGFSGWALQDGRHERRAEKTHRTETVKQYGRKRKMTEDLGQAKKENCVAGKDAVSDDWVQENSDCQHRRVPGGTHAKYLGRDEMVSDELEEDHSLQHRGAPTSKEGKCIQREDAISEDTMDNNTHQQRWTVNSEEAESLRREVGSDDSMEYTSHEWKRRILQSEQTRSTERDDAVSDDSLGHSSRRQHMIFARSKQTECVAMEETITHGHPDDHFPKQKRRAPKTRQAKHNKGGNTVSDVLLGSVSFQQCRSICKRRQAKCIAKEDSLLNEPSETNSPLHQRVAKRKQVKCMERDDMNSDDLLEGNSRQLHKRVLRSQQTKRDATRQMIQENPGRQKQQISQPLRKGTWQLRKPKTPRQATQSSQVKNSQFEKSTQFGSCNEEEKGGPSTRLRKRVPKVVKETTAKPKEKQTSRKKAKHASNEGKTKDDDDTEYHCDIEGCNMSFGSKQELALHKRNICPVKGCGKKFFSHKYLVQHRRVHVDERPLRCPWKGCKMTFKWAWARTEHIRVHTGARPYACAEPGCGQTFRFVSDFSRHKRKTGHSAKKSRG